MSWVLIIIGIIVTFFCTVIARRMNKGLVPRKRGAIVGLLGFAGILIFAVGIIMNMVSTHHSRIAVASPTNHHSESSNQTFVSQNTTNTTTTTPETNSATETSKSPRDLTQYIPGLDATTVKLNLQKTWGLKFKLSQGANGTWLYSGQTVDPDTGATLECTIYWKSLNQVEQVEFVVDGSGVAGSESSTNISTVASGYLGYSATAPYTKADTVKAKKWVQSTIESSSKSSETDINGVQFRVLSTEWVKTLNISNSKFTG